MPYAGEDLTKRLGTCGRNRTADDRARIGSRRGAGDADYGIKRKTSLICPAGPPWAACTPGNSPSEMTRKLLALLVCTALPLPALAQTHVIAELGTAPLIGRVASTQQLQTDVSKQRQIFEAAGLQLGLTPEEYAQFEQRIAQRRLAYVVIPRRLDAMSWRSGGRVHVLHDVLIPAHTMGWEVDLREHDRIVALFIPNKCGNLSLLRKPAPLLASTAPVVKDVAIAPSPSPAPTLAPTPAPAASPAIAPSPAPYANLAMSTSNAPAHHFRAWPLLLLPLIALLVSHGHSGPAAPPMAPALPGAPTPPPAGCPTPAPH